MEQNWTKANLRYNECHYGDIPLLGLGLVLQYLPGTHTACCHRMFMKKNICFSITQIHCNDMHRSSAEAQGKLKACLPVLTLDSVNLRQEKQNLKRINIVDVLQWETRSLAGVQVS